MSTAQVHLSQRVHCPLTSLPAGFPPLLSLVPGTSLGIPLPPSLKCVSFPGSSPWHTDLVPPPHLITTKSSRLPSPMASGSHAASVYHLWEKHSQRVSMASCLVCGRQLILGTPMKTAFISQAGFKSLPKSLPGWVAWLSWIAYPFLVLTAPQFSALRKGSSLPFLFFSVHQQRVSNPRDHSCPCGQGLWALLAVRTLPPSSPDQQLLQEPLPPVILSLSWGMQA